MSEIYLLDSNVFIEAKQRYYAFDVCPGFGDALIWHGDTARARVQSIDRVRQELLDFDDDLSMWVKDTIPPSCFVTSEISGVIALQSQIMAAIASNPQYLPAAVSDFAGGADPWLVAFAKVHGMILVTHEVLNPVVKRKVPIPNVCQQFGVEFSNTFEMLRKLEAQFAWQPPA